MKAEQIYTSCLAQGAHYIESDGEVAIIDPLRETEPYLRKAGETGAKIKYIFETHFHADFVSGHLELAHKTGAKIIYGSGANADFDCITAEDGRIFALGKVSIKALHTPGHTLESTSYLLFDEAGKEHAIFSGDTLFIGDVGRPDLVQKGLLSQEDLAGMLYDSLRKKIMTLPDDVIIYPAHGAGSACGKNMSKETSDLLGNQKKTNYALRADMTKEAFIGEVTDGLLPPPRYFAQNVAMNKTGAKYLDEVLEKGNIPLDIGTFEAMAHRQGVWVLDTRHQKEFIKAHIPNSIFVGIDGNFAPWVGAVMADVRQSVIFLAAEGREKEVVMRLSRVGCDQTLGFLKGGIEAWRAGGKKTASLTSIPATEFAEIYRHDKPNIIDVRKENEFRKGHIEGAKNLSLDYLHKNIHQTSKDELYYLHCAGGYRSVIAASILKSEDRHHLVDVAGGFQSIRETDIPVTCTV